jgi:hypothetical protein
LHDDILRDLRILYLAVHVTHIDDAAALLVRYDTALRHVVLYGRDITSQDERGLSDRE